MSDLSSRLRRRLRSSEQDKISESHIEFALFALWRINIKNLINIKASIAKNFHIAPSEIDRMPMWEYEMFLMELNDQIKEENKQQQAEMDKYHIDDYRKMADPKNISKMTNPKMPSMNMSMPKFK